MANEKNLIPFKKGFDIRREGNGRPKKYISTLSEIGYTNYEINETIKNILGLSLSELKDLNKNPNATILEVTIANALIKCGGKGNIYIINELLNRILGKPKEMSHMIPDNKIEVVFVEGKTIL